MPEPVLAAALRVPHIFTANLLVIGLVRGLIIAVLAMGIVLVYRSSRVINFAVGNIGIPCAALLAIMAGKGNWPYWPSLILAVGLGAVAGTVIDQDDFFDYNVSKKFALRFSPGFYMTQFGGQTQHNFRFSVGPVFKIGGDR